MRTLKFKCGGKLSKHHGQSSRSTRTQIPPTKLRLWVCSVRGSLGTWAVSTRGLWSVNPCTPPILPCSITARETLISGHFKTATSFRKMSEHEFCTTKFILLQYSIKKKLQTWEGKWYSLNLKQQKSCPRHWLCKETYCNLFFFNSPLQIIITLGLIPSGSSKWRCS